MSTWHDMQAAAPHTGKWQVAENSHCMIAVLQTKQIRSQYSATLRH